MRIARAAMRQPGHAGAHVVGRHHADADTVRVDAVDDGTERTGRGTGVGLAADQDLAGLTPHGAVGPEQNRRDVTVAARGTLQLRDGQPYGEASRQVAEKRGRWPRNRLGDASRNGAAIGCRGHSGELRRDDIARAGARRVLDQHRNRTAVAGDVAGTRAVAECGDPHNAGWSPTHDVDHAVRPVRRFGRLDRRDRGDSACGCRATHVPSHESGAHEPAGAG
jgi:hypothetical protein